MRAFVDGVLAWCCSWTLDTEAAFLRLPMRTRVTGAGGFRGAVVRALLGFALLLPASVGAAQSQTSAVIARIAAQFDRHPLVMLGELHRSREIHAFLQQMLRDPAFICRVDDVVVESGNARFQPLVDSYVFGGDVSQASLANAWRETAVPLTWNSPLYRQVFVTLREVNRAHLCPARVRVLLGDPPLDWSKIHTKEDYAPWTDRDGHYASVVERDVLGKGHRGFLIAGEFHAMKTVPKDLQDDPPAMTVAQILERDHPGALFSLVSVPLRNGSRALEMGKPPAFALVHDTARERMSYQFVDWESTISRGTGSGSAKWVLTPDKHWPTIGDMVDGLLYVGGNHSVYPSPTIYLDPAYQRELRRRATIIKDYSGQDFLLKIDDLVREGERLRRSRSPRSRRLP
jgi:hypothetical protein